MSITMTQRDFAAGLLDPTHIPLVVRVAAGIDPARRFVVHRNNVMVALVDALASTFPVTRALVGADFFADMARDYVRIDPPRSPVIADYGEDFGSFIAMHAPAAGVPYLADMARLEHLRMQAYHAADAIALAPDAYTALLAAPQRLVHARLRLQPACRWLSSQYAVFSLWSAHQHADADRDAALAALDTNSAEDVLVIRPQWDVQLIALPAGGIAWLDALRDGVALGDALACAVEANVDARPDALFALLLQHGLATAIDCPKEH